MDTVKASKQLIIAGDLNTKVPIRQDDHVVETYGAPSINNNGERLIKIWNVFSRTKKFILTHGPDLPLIRNQLSIY